MEGGRPNYFPDRFVETIALAHQWRKVEEAKTFDTREDAAKAMKDLVLSGKCERFSLCIDYVYR